MARPQTPKRKKRLSPFWAKQLHTWHWMSSAICLIGMLLFAITGITLNHAGSIEGQVKTETVTRALAPDLADFMRGHDGETDTVVPAPLADWIVQEFGETVTDRPAEWSDDEVYIPLPRPGGDGWIAIDRANGTAEYETTDRGWISWLNDLHKGRDTGAAWSWFIDIFAGACVIFCLTGFFLLQLHARHRPSTWPIVGAGLVIPLLLITLFMHS
ncbi:PepSY-associated TM helix domain-containing protein [Parasphingorhabdus sp.]|uniref:PepSY-associated TM helix domain-containing protein n=1 Tax=Parasphingorhabdus sp. TaxID=2709688 RepID=UPI003A91A71B